MPDVRIYSEEETVIGMFLSDGEYGVNPEEETWEEIPV